MFRKVAALCLPLLGILLGSCMEFEQYRLELDRMSAQISLLKTENSKLSDDQKKMHNDLEQVSRMAGCPNPVVREFMRACSSGSGTECSPQMAEHAIMLMASNPDHVMAAVRPQQSAALSAVKVGYIKTLLRQHVRAPTTRLLVVAMPAGRDAKDTEMAESVARRLRNWTVETLYPSVHAGEEPLPALPPVFLSCAQKEEILRRYLKANPQRDVPVPGEPGLSERRILLWFFLVDC